MNMMKYCPECYKELPPDSASCPFCGYKTGNNLDQDHEARQILKTPQTDSYITPEQTVLSLLLLVIFFWGINIALTVLPIFLDAGTTRNLLIAGITSQVLTRILIGIWALEEQSLKKDQTTNKKIGAFLLTFIPIGGIFSFLNAAKTIIRKDRLTNLTISSVFAAIIMSVLLYATADNISALASGSEISAAVSDTTPDPALQEVINETATPIPTPTTRVYLDGCRNPASITTAEEGNITEVCGKITNFGIYECATCPQGFYSFIKLDGAFQIVSYDWRFSFTWLGKCVRVSDVVEILGEDPIFVFNRSEGCTGTECITDVGGELVDDGGIYFQDYFKCK
jgi:hypothetical protein